MISQMSEPLAVWIMVPAGARPRSTVNELAGSVEPGDIIIEKTRQLVLQDDIRRAKAIALEVAALRRRRHLGRRCTASSAATA